jgi:hypothetical protein
MLARCPRARHFVGLLTVKLFSCLTLKSIIVIYSMNYEVTDKILVITAVCMILCACTGIH